MKKNNAKNLFWAMTIMLLPFASLSANVNRNDGNILVSPVKNKLTDYLKPMSKIANMNFWNMQFDNTGKTLENPYVGIILPLGIDIDQNVIKNIVKEPSKSSIKLNSYDKNRPGIYDINIDQSGNQFTLKIFLVDKAFNFKKVFTNKTLDDNFAIPKGVTTIGDDIFYSSKLNNNFRIPESVLSIGKLAFRNIDKLPEGFKLPNGISKIDSYTFQNTGLNKDFKIPNSVEEISDGAFLRSKLNDRFKITNNVKIIGSSAFQEANLKEGFFVPNNVTYIGNYAFSWINKLPKGFKLSNQINKINNNLFTRTGLNDDFILPNSIETIGKSAFQQAKLNENFIIPKNVNYIGQKAFQKSELNKGFIVPDTVETIDDLAFSSIKELPENFRLPNNLSKINKGLFSWTKLNKNFEIPSSIKEIERYAFYNGELNDTFTLPQELTKYNSSILQGAKMKSISLENKYINSKEEANETFKQINSIDNLIIKFIQDKDRNTIFNKSLSSEDFNNIWELISLHYKNKNNYEKCIVDHFFKNIKYDDEGLKIEFTPSVKLESQILIEPNAFADSIAKKEINLIKPTKKLMLEAEKPEVIQRKYISAIKSASSRIDAANSIEDLNKIKMESINEVSMARDNLDDAIELSNDNLTIKKETIEKNGYVGLKRNFYPEDNKKLTSKDLNIKSPKGFNYTFADSSEMDENGQWKVTININLDKSDTKTTPQTTNFIIKSIKPQNTQKTPNENNVDFIAKEKSNISKGDGSSKNIWWIIIGSFSAFIIISIFSIFSFKKLKKRKK